MEHVLIEKVHTNNVKGNKVVMNNVNKLYNNEIVSRALVLTSKDPNVVEAMLKISIKMVGD